MSDNPNTALAIGIVAVITAVSSGIVLICKTLKKSDCLGIHIETRTPPPVILAPPPSPAAIHKIKTEEHIKEVEV
jgi:hypothetical protein